MGYHHWSIPIMLILALRNTILVMAGLEIMEYYIPYLFLTEPDQRGHLGLVFWIMSIHPTP